MKKLFAIIAGGGLNLCCCLGAVSEGRGRLLWVGDAPRASETFLPALALVGPFRIAVEPVHFACFGRLLLDILCDDEAGNNQEAGAVLPSERDEHVDMALTPKVFATGAQQPEIRRCGLVRFHLNGPRMLTLVRDEKVRAESVSCGKRNHEATTGQFSSSEEHTLHSVLEFQSHGHTSITRLAQKQGATDLAPYSSASIRQE